MESINLYILSDVLVFCIAEYFTSFAIFWQAQNTDKILKGMLDNKEIEFNWACSIIKRFIIQHAQLLCPYGWNSQIFIDGEYMTELSEAEWNWGGKSS